MLALGIAASVAVNGARLQEVCRSRGNEGRNVEVDVHEHDGGATLQEGNVDTFEKRDVERTTDLTGARIRMR